MTGKDSSMRSGAIVRVVVLGLSLAAALPVTAIAQSTGLEDMVGVRAGQAEGELQRRGYRNIPGGEKTDDRSCAFWWNADRRQCVTIATMNGRYSSITPSPPPDCRQPASMRPDQNYQGRPASRPPHGYEPDPGYGRPPYRPANEGVGYPVGSGPIVDGRSVELGLVCFGDGAKDGIAIGTARGTPSAIVMITAVTIRRRKRSSTPRSWFRRGPAADAYGCRGR